MNKNIINGTLALLFVLIVCISSAAAVDDTVTRDLSPTTTTGVSITISLTVDVETNAAYYVIDEVVPSGWTVTSATDDGDYTSDTGRISWLVLQDATDKVYSYTITVPTDASGTYMFDGEYMFEGAIGMTPILGNNIITITDDRIPGDVTDNGVVNIGDAVLLFNWVSFPNERGTTYAFSAPKNADVNGDDKVNIGDAVLLFNWVSFPNDRGTTYVLH